MTAHAKLNSSATDSATDSMANSAFVTIHSPIGRIEIQSNGEAVTAITIEGDDGREYGRLPHNGDPGKPDPVLLRASTQLQDYFAGKLTHFTVPVHLEGTAFQKDVWHVIANTPFGETASYGEIADRIGRRGAGRAVGGAVGANPVPLIVGCHRILASDRRITGYSGGSGISTKKQLLALEGISFAD